MTYILISALAIMLTSLIGLIAVWKVAGKFIQNKITYLVSLSAGIFLIISLYLLLEGIELLGTGPALAWAGFGAAGGWLLFKLLPVFHHHHTAGETSTHSTIDARKILIGDGLHNMADGVLLVSSFAVSPTLGFITAAGILLHEAVQELSEFFVLREAGYSVKQALLLNFITSGTILIGAVGSYFLIERFAFIEPILLTLSAGLFMLVVVIDLIPHSIRHLTGPRRYWLHGTAFIAGLLLMSSVFALTPHQHAHGDGHSHHDHDHEDAPRTIV
jgi:zinc and cadmium transporter